MTEPLPEVELLSVRETARRLHVHENTVRNWFDTGQLHAVPMPGSGFRRARADEVNRLALWVTS